MRILIIPTSFILLLFYCAVNGQPSNFQAPVSINEDGSNPDKNAMLDIQSTNKGLLIPRMPFCDIEKINTPTEGLMIYDTEFHCLRIYIQGRWHCLYQKFDGPGAELNITGWANPTYDEGFNTSIAIDSKENVYVTMATEDDEIGLTKFDNKGNILWDIFEPNGRKHGSASVDLNDYIFTIASSDGDKPISFNGLTLNEEGCFITKTNPTGANTKIYTLPNSIINDMAIDKNGNVFFVFTFRDEVIFNGVSYYNDIPDGRKVGIAKLDNNLNEVWVEILTVFIDDLFSYGGGSTAIDVDEEGDVYVTGRHDNGVEPIPIQPSEIKAHNFFISKLAALDGEPIWTKNYGSELIITDVNIQWTDLYSGGNVFLATVETNTTSFWPPEVSKGKLLHYGALSGHLNSTTELPGNVARLNFDVNNTRNEVAFTFISNLESSDYRNIPAKLLMYDYNNLTYPKKIIDQSFNRPGALSFSKDGSKIYGIANGKTVGNVTIDQGPFSENHVIYKIYND